MGCSFQIWTYSHDKQTLLNGWSDKKNKYMYMIQDLNYLFKELDNKSTFHAVMKKVELKFHETAKPFGSDVARKW